ncbi:hypothetical protein [Arthrobacter sp. NPDC090010]|uniref:hypothetical protein n=1 Tax=Arthrobacter sp. NPDC090010 TaxID=3363942 RepID=UPI003807685B
METYNDFPDDSEARRWLDEAADAENATRNPPLPWVFFALQAALLALLFWVQLLPAEYVRGAALLCAAAIIAVGARWVFLRPGYGFVAPDLRRAFPYLCLIVLGAGIPAAVALGTGLAWLWVIAGAIAAVVTLGMGRQYRQAFLHA